MGGRGASVINQNSINNMREQLREMNKQALRLNIRSKRGEIPIEEYTAYIDRRDKLASRIEQYEKILANHEEKRIQQAIANNTEEGQAIVYMRNQLKQSSNAAVNGYDERTNRNITSSTYERARRRQERDFDRWFGRR